MPPPACLPANERQRGTAQSTETQRKAEQELETQLHSQPADLPCHWTGNASMLRSHDTALYVHTDTPSQVTPAHTKRLGWHVEFAFRVRTHPSGSKPSISSEHTHRGCCCEPATHGETAAVASQASRRSVSEEELCGCFCLGGRYSTFKSGNRRLSWQLVGVCFFTASGRVNQPDLYVRLAALVASTCEYPD